MGVRNLLFLLPPDDSELFCGMTVNGFKTNLNSEKWTVPLSIFNELLNPLVNTNYRRMNFWNLFGIGIKNYPYTQKIGLNPCNPKKKVSNNYVNIHQIKYCR